jgi:hypothetical protein
MYPCSIHSRYVAKALTYPLSLNTFIYSYHRGEGYLRFAVLHSVQTGSWDNPASWPSVPQPVCRHKVKGVTRTFTYYKKLIVEFYSFYFIPIPCFIFLYFILSHCTALIFYVQ